MSYLDQEMSDSFEIIVGTYEQYLLGYKVNNIVNEYRLEKSFATHSHVASIRSIANSKYYLASAGADDTVCLYDMRYRTESGKLMHHNDTINCIAFTPEASHLFTCSKDGSITAIRCGNWKVEKCWPQAHKGLAVNALAIHPTGKLALSTGMDGVLKTWNLVKGRQAYATNLIPRLKYDARNVTIIRWSPNGEKYLLAVSQKIDIYSVETAKIDREFTFDTKIICVEFLKDNLIAVGFEDGQIKFCDLRTSKQTLETAAHDVRVKCIAYMNNLLVSASSSGEIKLWKYNKHSLNMLQTVNCGARITCLSLALCKSLVQQKQEKLEEKQEVKKKSNFRLKQEVIIEDESEPKKTIIPKKKRNRSLEDSIDKPRKKKMLEETKKASFSSQKRKKDDLISQDTLLSVKKLKRTNEIKQSSITGKKHKVKLSNTEIIKDAPPKKKRKEGKNSLKGNEKEKKRKKKKSTIENRLQ